MKTVLDSLTKNNVTFEVFTDVTIEPTDVSFKRAIDWAKKGGFDSYLAVGEIFLLFSESTSFPTLLFCLLNFFKTAYIKKRL